MERGGGRVREVYITYEQVHLRPLDIWWPQDRQFRMRVQTSGVRYALKPTKLQDKIRATGREVRILLCWHKFVKRNFFPNAQLFPKLWMVWLS